MEFKIKDSEYNPLCTLKQSFKRFVHQQTAWISLINNQAADSKRYGCVQGPGVTITVEANLPPDVEGIYQLWLIFDGTDDLKLESPTDILPVPGHRGLEHRRSQVARCRAAR